MSGTRVADVMKGDVPAVRPDTSVKEIVRTLSAHGARAVAVVGAEGQVVGVVSDSDLFADRSGPAPAGRAGRAQQRAVRGFHRLRPGRGREPLPEATVAGQLMTQPPVTVTAEQLVTRAAALMRENDVRQLPVVDRAGRFRGMVTRVDVLEPYLRPDAALREEIAQEVLAAQFCLDPATVDVQVRDGVVTLRGFLESVLQEQPLLDAVRAVEGVVAVESRLNCGRGEPGRPAPQAFH